MMIIDNFDYTKILQPITICLLRPFRHLEDGYFIHVDPHKWTEYKVYVHINLKKGIDLTSPTWKIRASPLTHFPH